MEESASSSVTGISRSGRVRKKSSKLVDFESPDDINSNKKSARNSESYHQQGTMVVDALPPDQLLDDQATEDDEEIEIESIERKKETQETDPEEETDLKEEDFDTIPDVEDIFDQDKGVNDQFDHDMRPEEEKVDDNRNNRRQKSIKGTKRQGRPFKMHFTGYMLWAKRARTEMLKENPSMEFATLSLKLKERWATLSRNEKYNWKRKAQGLATKSNFKNSISKPPKQNESTLIQNSGLYKVVGTEPIDTAAHLKLLGESLSIIGERLTEHEGQIAVSGSLSVLLDSLLCAMGPLLCLTQQVPELNAVPQAKLNKILDNVAYIMPGL